MMPTVIAHVPLFAAGFDWLEALLPLAFALFWIISQIVAAVRKIAGGGGEAARPAAAPPRRPRPVAADREVARELRDEIREFLRRDVVEQRQALPSDFPKPTERTPPSPPKPRPASQRSRPPLADRPDVMRQPSSVSLSGESIAEKVKEDFARELEHLSTPLTADRVLATPQPGGAVVSASRTSRIVRSLRSPETLRELVVIREILERPVERW